MVDISRKVRWVAGSIDGVPGSLSYVLFQSVLLDWCNKARGIYYPVCGMVCMIRKSSP